MSLDEDFSAKHINDNQVDMSLVSNSLFTVSASRKEYFSTVITKVAIIIYSVMPIRQTCFRLGKFEKKRWLLPPVELWIRVSHVSIDLLN